eukprot:CAMPEP_0197588632 /NCGR_PEP_ID=MMETSP1326-20131121/9848_1 /TAXON_ID=1155430 /ORGANISM="Genus nov. species nov., Strain RCC2288" /LENGTH=197 /DNA_ID=CAMNT_0043153479 /DNA_START=61 /DNA_END=654 /DNA_ORIENTATION=+
MSRMLTAFALVAAFAVTGASAGATYASTPNTGVVTIGGGKTCGAGHALKGGVGTIDLAWSNFTIVGETMAVKLCYTNAKIVDRPWRKFVGTIDKNKQCWQTAKLAKFLVETMPYAATGSMPIPLPMNTAPSDYTVQLLSKVNGTYAQYGDSKGTSCALTTTIYENQPASLVGTQVFFTVFSLVVLVVSYVIDKKRQP